MTVTQERSYEAQIEYEENRNLAKAADILRDAREELAEDNDRAERDQLLRDKAELVAALELARQLAESFYVATLTNAKSRDENQDRKITMINAISEILAKHGAAK